MNRLNGISIIGALVLLIQCIAEGCAVYQLLKLNVFLDKYVAAIIAILVLLLFLSAFLLFYKGKHTKTTMWKVIGIILSLLVIIPCASAAIVISKANQTLHVVTEPANQIDTKVGSAMEKTEVQKDTTEPFVVYVSGSDTRSEMLDTSRSDVNIIMAVNPKEKQILMVNTPRDYYVPNPAGNGALDKLTHCGIYGIDCSMQALSDLYQTEINYYVQINFTGFETLVDALGGIEVYSDTTFSTNGYSYSVGNNVLNGAQALTFVRDRYNQQSGDNARGIHQMAVIQAIIKKATSGTTLLTKYSSILDSLQGMFVTNIGTEMISSLVKMQLTDAGEWDVVSYAVTGTGGKNTTYSMPNFQAYVMYPDQSTVEHATDLLSKVLAGERLEEDGAG